MEVDERLQRNLSPDVLLLLGLLDLLAEVVERGYVGVVVVLVVQFHDFARDVGFERAIVVCKCALELHLFSCALLAILHGRSGSVALPRTNVVPASPAREVVGAAARTAERRAVVRRIVVFMVPTIDVDDSIGGGCRWCYSVVRLALELWGKLVINLPDISSYQQRCRSPSPQLPSACFTNPLFTNASPSYSLEMQIIHPHLIQTHACTTRDCCETRGGTKG